MRIWKYDSYQEYVDAQTKANKKKLKNVWVQRETIEKIKQYKPTANSIICHGTRNAKEQKLFKEIYQCDVIGTEISDTASQFPMTVQHDFHEQKQEWVESYDILYSNSFDHSYDPVRSFCTWRDQITSNGIMVIELMLSNIIKESDPLDMSEQEFRELASDNNCSIVDEFKTKQLSKAYIIKK